MTFDPMLRSSYERWAGAVLAVATLAAVMFAPVLGSEARAQDSLIVKKSPHTVSKTLDRFAEAAKGKGLKVFTRIDHAAGAESAGLELRPTELIVIGNPNVGTPLMQSDQRVALDLPLRVAAWQAEDDTVWIGYWSPEVFAVQYGLDGQDERLKKMSAALDGLTDAAIAEE